jgi:predicted nucleic acid-binding protein
LNIGVNDTLVYNTMKEKGITEVYSFDKDFDGLPGIRRIAN